MSAAEGLDIVEGLMRILVRRASPDGKTIVIPSEALESMVRDAVTCARSEGATDLAEKLASGGAKNLTIAGAELALAHCKEALSLVAERWSRIGGGVPS